MKVFVICASVLVVMLQYKLWFAADGVSKVGSLTAKVAEQIEQNDALKERNSTIAREIIALRDGADVVEGHAREELGMVKEGEVFYQVVKS